MTDTGQALAMLSAFASVGARLFDVSFTDINENPVEGLQRTRETLEQLRRRIGRDGNLHSVASAFCAGKFTF